MTMTTAPSPRPAAAAAPLTTGLDRVRIGLYEPAIRFRDPLVARLHRAGFTAVQPLRSRAMLEREAARSGLDVLILSLDEEPDELCRFAAALRRGKAGRNPFLVMIAMIGAAPADRTAALLDAGFDDILVKTYALEAAIDRLSRFLAARKPFVVTADYVGPDRRARARGDGDEPVLFDAPNPVRLRAVGCADDAMMHAAIREGAEALSRRKLQRNAQRVAALATGLRDALLRLAEAPPEIAVAVQDSGHCLESVLALLEDSAPRLGGHARAEDARTLCESLTATCRRMLMSGESAHPRVDALAELAEQAALFDAVIAKLLAMAGAGGTAR